MDFASGGTQELMSVGYEKAHWDRLENERRKNVERLIKGPGEEDEGSDGEADRGDYSKSTSVEPEKEPEKRTKISLRGASGTYVVRVADYVTGTTLAKVFCEKAGKPASEVEKLRLTFDGDRIESETTVKELDLEDGDIIDVE